MNVILLLQSVVVNTHDDMHTIPSLQSKVAIVTGASRGIGRGIAIELGRAGMTVYVVGRSSTATGYISNERELGGGTTTLEDRNRYTVEGTVDEINKQSIEYWESALIILLIEKLFDGVSYVIIIRKEYGPLVLELRSTIVTSKFYTQECDRST